MKVAILAGGFGTRISEETTVKPKPMVNVGDKPIIWHIMRHYAHYGLKDFVVLCGYKGEILKEYFLNYKKQNADFTVDLSTGSVEIISASDEDWKVTLVDTGANTMTGGRILSAKNILGDDPFFLTYGDGLSTIPIDQLLACHRQNNRWATVSAVRQPGRFGVLGIDKSGQKITGFREKGINDGGYINGGFFVCEPQIFDYIENDQTVWEREPLEQLVADDQLTAYKHDGFWQSMDTLRDKNVLESLWSSDDCPWRKIYET